MRTIRYLLYCILALPLAVSGDALAAKRPLPARIAAVKTLLAQAGAASKSPAVKKGIAAATTLLNQGQFQPARDRVGELKRTAALGGESAAVVRKLLAAEDEIGSIARKASKPGKKR